MQEFIDAINWALVTPILIIQGILLLIALIDWAKADNLNGSKWLWFWIIILLNTVGPIIYFVFGRRRS